MKLSRFAYVARYPLSDDGKDLIEVIIARDSFWSPKLNAAFDEAVKNRRTSDPMVQGWYSDQDQATLIASTNQPFPLS